MRREFGTVLVLSAKNREDFCREIDFHPFSVDQWGFEVNGLRSHVPHIGSPPIASKPRIVFRFICDVSSPCHERRNERTSARTNSRTQERTHERKDELTNAGTNARKNSRTQERTHERRNERTFVDLLRCFFKPATNGRTHEPCLFL